MSKVIWVPGVPTVPGIYWWDGGLRFDWQNKKDQIPLVLQVTSEDQYVYGDNSSMPLSSVYSERLNKKAQHAAIEQTEDWQDLSCIKERRSRAWVKDPDGNIGFGLLEPGTNDDVGGTILWINHPNLAAQSGMWIKSDKNYQFSLVKRGKLP